MRLHRNHRALRKDEGSYSVSMDSSPMAETWFRLVDPHRLTLRKPFEQLQVSVPCRPRGEPPPASQDGHVCRSSTWQSEGGASVG
jgi:hypothetical protein